MFDIKGRLLRVTEPDSTGKDTIYGYDEVGNLLYYRDRRTPAGEKTVEYEYNELNRLKREKYRDGTRFDYEYDRNGNIIRKRDANGQGGLFGIGSYDIDYEYDEANRLVEIRYPTDVLDLQHSLLNTNIQYGYDKNNNRVYMKDRLGVHRYYYNTRNWLTNEVIIMNPSVIPAKAGISYFYNTVGDLKKVTYPGGTTVEYKVNTLHRTKQIKLLNSPFSFLASYKYNPMGTIKEINFANNTKQTFEYDTRDRVTSLILYSPYPSPHPLLHHKYEYDKVGNRIKLTEENGLVTRYEYDKLYRLTRVKFPGKTPNKEIDFKYEYDSVGNRTKFRSSYQLFEYQYDDDSNQLNKVTMDVKSSINYEYDKNGNLIKETHKRLDKTIKEVKLDWDFENRLIRMKYPYNRREKFKGKENIKDSILEFGYDGDGKRVIKRIKYGDKIKKEKVYIYDSSGQVIEEYEVRNGETKTNIYIGGVLRISDNKKEFICKDVLGSTILLTDEEGNQIQRYKYSPFGSIEYSKGISDNKYQFTGKERDAESGLIYYGERYLDPKPGRWISRDLWAGSLSNPQSLNRYLYCENNPLKYYDVLGLVKIVVAGTGTARERNAFKARAQKWIKKGFILINPRSGNELISMIKKI